MKESKRQNRWRELGYTDEQINRHLEFERYKQKQIRERRNNNNQKNKEIINIIKKDVLGKTFNLGNKKITVLNINPSVDGLGFWYQMVKVFKDGSSGKFRNFCYFEEYNKKDFKESLII